MRWLKHRGVMVNVRLKYIPQICMLILILFLGWKIKRKGGDEHQTEHPKPSCCLQYTLQVISLPSLLASYGNDNINVIDLKMRTINYLGTVWEIIYRVTISLYIWIYLDE